MINIFLLSTVALLFAIIVWTIVRAVRSTLTVMHTLGGRIDPVVAALREGRTPSPDQIQELAASAETRSLLRTALLEMNRADLFPPQYATPEALAESDLVVWLLHRSELGAEPEAVELVATIERPDEPAIGHGRYFVFRFRMSPPHPKAESGWLAGVAGPYYRGDEAFDSKARGVFSDFEPFDARSPEDHLAWLVHNARS